MSYRRYRRNYRRNSTGVIKMKFQSFMDISTDTDSMKIITISAGGKNILERCRAQFSAYKFYKIGNISVKLVPASTLPADPTGLSYEAGENTVDPRDQLSPGLMRITNGEDILEDITGVSDDAQHKIYNSMMLDPHWYKWMLQRGVKRHATPRYWQIGQLHQDKWPGATRNWPMQLSQGAAHFDTACRHDETYLDANQVSKSNASEENFSSMYGFFQTGHKGVLGWMPTDGFQELNYRDENGTLSRDRFAFLASPPEIAVFTICLPKAYKTRYYYRAFISETVYFREPIVSLDYGAGGGYAPIDVFHRIPAPYSSNPIYEHNESSPDYEDGGNYGNH